METFLNTSDAARLLGKARDTVLYYERTGKLVPIRTQSGMRLFRKDEVERLVAEQARLQTLRQSA
jgi:DNA-binding transcriptional MerR regulator